MDATDENGTAKKPEDPMKLTIEHLESIGKIWGEFAKAKFGPYVDQSKKWVAKYRKAAPPEPPKVEAPARTDAAA